MPGSFHWHLAARTPWSTGPADTEFAMDCRVSWSKPSWAAPCTKQPWSWDLNAWQTLSHSSRVVGGFRPYLSNSAGLIPERAGVDRADRGGDELAVLGQPADAGGRDLVLPVVAQRLDHHRGQVLGERAVVASRTRPAACRRRRARRRSAGPGGSAACQSEMATSLKLTLMSGYSLLNAAM